MRSDHIGRKYNELVSWDNGKTFENEKWESNIEINFKLSTTQINQRIVLWKISDTLALFGGLINSLSIVFFLIGTSFNLQLLLAKSLEILYFVNKDVLAGKKQDQQTK